MSLAKQTTDFINSLRNYKNIKKSMSRSVMSPASVYVNETKSFALGLELLQNYLGSVRCILPENVQIYCVGDNQPSTVVLSEQYYSNTTIVGVRNVCIDMLSRILRWLPDCNVIFSWLSTKLMVSDLVSKAHDNPILQLESDFWRHGPKIYHDEKYLMLFKFCTFNENGKHYQALPYMNNAESLEEAISVQCLYQLQTFFLPPDEVDSASTPYHYMSTCMVTTRSGKSLETKQNIKSVKKRFQSKDICSQLRLLTKTKGSLDEHWITPNFELSEFCNNYMLGDDIYQRILLDLSNFGLSLRTLACVLRVCKKFKSGKVDMDYSLEKNIADAFCILVKADQSRFKPQNVKYLMKAECGVLFFIRHIVEVQNIFTSPAIVSC